jgi:hypothetical protein
MSTVTKTTESRYWKGATPVACDGCLRPIITTFIDGAVRGTISWANLCLRCHRQIGVGVGPGCGQLYRIQTDGRFLKAEG